MVVHLHNGSDCLIMSLLIYFNGRFQLKDPGSQGGRSVMDICLLLQSLGKPNFLLESISLLLKFRALMIHIFAFLFLGIPLL